MSRPTHSQSRNNPTFVRCLIWEASPPLSRRFTDIRGIFHHSIRKSEFRIVFVFVMASSRVPARTNFEQGVIILLSCWVWHRKTSDSELKGSSSCEKQSAVNQGTTKLRTVVNWEIYTRGRNFAAERYQQLRQGRL